MEYKYSPENQKKFATGIRINIVSKKMTWDTSKGVDTLVVQTAYEKEVNTIIPALCKELNQKDLKKETYTQIMDEVWVRYVPAEEKAANGGCEINMKASRYTVLACQKEGNICEIYAPYEHGMNIPYYDIPLEMHIDLQKQISESGKGRKKNRKFRGFYILTFPDELKTAYIENSLCYKVDGLEIPVTIEMVRQGTVYIESNMEPEIVPLNKGILLRN